MRNDSAGLITAACACPCCQAAPGHVCTDLRTGRPFAGQIVHTERVRAANCTCFRFQPGGVGPWQIIADPRCDVHGDDDD